MADLFSIAGSTVSVISLGLQVCNMLVSYCRSVRDADQDIQSIANKATGLRVPLKTLRDILEEEEMSDVEANSRRPPGKSEITEDMRAKVEAIVAAITRLKMAVDKYGPAASQGRLRAGYKKIMYPLRKETLQDMLKELDEIQMNLHTSLHL
ncbi:hypothetical protein BJX61DRAFT_505013 [Aspergillus egyptiacus]|nr:hypothetical protein BJX61DRAFT_505013 [Aspergillus egyptiacus]